MFETTTLGSEAPAAATLAATLLGGGFDTVDGELPCLQADADLWFAEQSADIEHAKQLCGPCPMRDDCLQGALERAEPWGVWGGEVFLAGRIVATKRGRGRPRKVQAA